MPRARWFAPVLLLPVLVASPAAAQTPAIITVDDVTPTIGQTVNVTVTCPDGVGVVDGTITRTPPALGAATPPLFAGNTSPFTFTVTFNVDGNFTITAQCTNADSLNSPPTSLPLTVTAEQTPTTAPTTIAPTTTIAPPTTAAPPTTGPVEPTTAVVSQTSAASVTTDPGQLPATGTSDSAALIAVILLGLGAMVLLVARNFRDLDD